MNAKLCRLALALALLAGNAPEAFADVPADFDDFVNRSMKEYNVPGASVAIVEGDKVFTRGYGVRSVAKPGAVDADTLFMLASCTKPFTAALMAIMVDRHKIGWNDKVIDSLPEFVLKDGYATRNSTPKDLLAHRTGLPAFTGDSLEALGFSREESMRRFRYIEPACSFREKANYSNPGLVVAGELAARLGGDSYENLIKKEIFEPLAMKRSGVTAQDHSKENVADAHMPIPGGGAKVIPWDASDTFGPAGEINSTANDMARFVQLQLNSGKIDGRQIISAESIKEMHTPAMVDEPSFAEMPPIDDNCGLSFGLGWGVYYYKGHTILEKGGARAGMRSVVVLVPDKKIGVVVLSNQNLNVLPEAIRAYVLDKMVAPAGVDLQGQISEVNQKIIKMFTPQPAPKETNPPTVALANYCGEYENQLYGRLKVYVDGKDLRWQAGPAKISGSLTHIGYDNFQLAWPPGRISLPEDVYFTLGPDGIPTQLQTETFGLLKRCAK
ncbi:MAG: serine hydrolase [Cyanobacteria bacterium SZAS LIN-3]|nr:serine hydrolase [Cyanobacteria bacterium SZAS LIN-3]